MTYIVTDQVVGHQAIADVSSTQRHPLGTIVRAKDADRGEGEFIYLKGATSTVAGSWVTYNMDDGTSTLIAANAIGPVAVAMAAVDSSSKYGWYQLQGKAVAIAGDVADNGNVYIASAGTCDDAVVTGDRVHNAKWASADDTTTTSADVEIARPFVDDGLGGGSS